MQHEQLASNIFNILALDGIAFCILLDRSLPRHPLKKYVGMAELIENEIKERKFWTGSLDKTWTIEISKIINQAKIPET